MEATKENLLILFHHCLSSDPNDVKAAEAKLACLMESDSLQGAIAGIFDIIESNEVDKPLRIMAVIYFKNFLSNNMDEPALDGIQYKIYTTLLKVCDIDGVWQQLISCVEKFCLDFTYAVEWDNVVSEIIDSCSKRTQNLPQLRVEIKVLRVIFFVYRDRYYKEQIMQALTSEKLAQLPSILWTIMQTYYTYLFQGKVVTDHNFLNHCLTILRYCCSVMVSISYFSHTVDKDTENILNLLTDLFPKLTIFIEIEELFESAAKLKRNILDMILCQIRSHSDSVSNYVVLWEEALINFMCCSDKSIITPEALLRPEFHAIVCGSIRALGAIYRHSRRSAGSKDAFQTLISRLITMVVIPLLLIQDDDSKLMKENRESFLLAHIEDADDDDLDEDSLKMVVLDFIDSLNVYNRDISFVVIVREIAGLIERSRASNQAPEQADRLRTTAVLLFTSLTAQGKSETHGALVEFMTDKIQVFFEANLQSCLNSIYKAESTCIMSTLAALKYLSVFRNQFSKEYLIGIFPEILALLSCENDLVRPCAANCIENIIIARDVHEKDPLGQPKFKPQEILKFLFSAVDTIMTLIKSQYSEESKYLVKCLNRIIWFSNTEMMPSFSVIIEHLICNMESENFYNNQGYAHYAFECLGTILGILYQNDSSFGQNPCSGIVNINLMTRLLVSESFSFQSYPLQIIRFMVYKSSGNYNQYEDVLDFVLKSTLWNDANLLPHLTELIIVFFLKKDVYHHSITSKMELIFQAIQKCLYQLPRRLCYPCFDFLCKMVMILPRDLYISFIPPVLQTALPLAKEGVSQLSKSLALFLCVLEIRSPRTGQLLEIGVSLTQDAWREYLTTSFVPSICSLNSTAESISERIAYVALARLYDKIKSVSDKTVQANIETFWRKAEEYETGTERATGYACVDNQQLFDYHPMLRIPDTLRSVNIPLDVKEWFPELFTKDLESLVYGATGNKDSGIVLNSQKSK